MTFDLINHRLLDEGAKASGVDAEVNKWIAQGLRGRSFRVNRRLCIRQRIAI